MTKENIISSRKYFIDNIRSFTVLIVIIFHVFYLFNSAGVPNHIGAAGIPIFDIFCYAVYPWIMPIMFLLAGISAQYALQKRTVKQFIKERVQKLLMPFLGVLLLLGWINLWVIFQQYPNIGNSTTGVGKYFGILLIAMGPVWFNLQLFLVSIILLVINKIDKNNNFWLLSGKTNIFLMLVLVVLYWASSLILNTPLITVFRNGIYLFCFLAGYYIFSHDKIIEILAKFSTPLLAVGILLGIITIYYFYKENFVEDYFLQHPLTNVYAWIIMMAIIGFSKKHLNKTNILIEYAKSRSFFWYLTHYPIMVFTAYVLITYFKPPFVFNYILLLILSFGITILFCEIVRLIPVLRYLLFGIKMKNKKA